jgi:hypothetical protein
MKPGDTFLIPDGIGTHLNCVLALGPDNSLILCHFTTMHRRSDRTLVIQPGEHPFFDRETVVRYDQVYICPESAHEALRRMITRMMEPLSPELLKRVKQGALDSPQTPDNIKALLR